MQDAADLFAVRGDREAMRFWDWPHDETPAETEFVIKQFLAEMRIGQASYWTVRLRADESFVGLCDLSDIQPTESADIGFMLVRRSWGQGLVGETVACLISYARAAGLRIVRARIHADNERSARVLSRAGFAEVATLLALEVRPGVRRDCRQFEIVLGPSSRVQCG